MKKLLGILVLGLLLNGNAFSKTISSYEDLDLTSKPKKVLSKSKTKSLWNAYKKAPKCFEHPTYGNGVGYKLKKKSKDYFLNNSWTSPFYKYKDDNRHKAILEDPLPKPIITINLNEDYGERQSEADSAIEFFQKAAYVARVGNSVEEVEKVKTLLLDWANNNALKEGINVSWGSKPVDYQMMVLINSILTTTATIAENFDANERQILGPWLNNLIKKVAKSKWKDRQDNKAYQTSYITLIWGLMVNDLNAVQNSIDVVKLAVHDMRPDGSFPIDTQRSGMGIDYWILEVLPEKISKILILEYNPTFGPNLEVTIPNLNDFDRKKYHYSSLCYGASLQALIKLMNKKKYVFVGSNIACFNAFFVLESEVKKLNLTLPNINDLTKYTTSYIRDSRSIDGKLNYLSGKQKLKEIENCEVIDLSNPKEKLVKIKDIY